MAKAYDIVVVGAGSTSLSAAAYMAKAGKYVLVLEKNRHCGGGAISVEVAPGFIHDPHATGLMTCMVSSALARDELGLKARHGLKFKEWSAAFTTLFDDSAVLATYQDVERTAQSIAKFSPKDAETYRELGRRCITLGPLLNAGAATPPLPFGRFLSLLEGNELGRELASGVFNSAQSRRGEPADLAHPRTEVHQ